MTLTAKVKGFTTALALASLAGAFSLPADAAPTLNKRKLNPGCVINGEYIQQSKKICDALKAKAQQPTLGKRKLNPGCVVNGQHIQQNRAICNALVQKQKAAEAKARAEHAQREQIEADKRARKEARREALKDAIVKLVQRAAEQE